MRCKRVWISEDLYRELKKDFCLRQEQKKKNGKKKRRYNFVEYTKDLANEAKQKKSINLKMLKGGR